MRLILAGLLLTAAAFAKGHAAAPKATSHAGHEPVRGYTSKKGAKVDPYHRTYANQTQRDNWTTKGNVNPDTGKKGTKPAKK